MFNEVIKVRYKTGCYVCNSANKEGKINLSFLYEKGNCAAEYDVNTSIIHVISKTPNDLPEGEHWLYGKCYRDITCLGVDEYKLKENLIEGNVKEIFNVLKLYV